MLFGEDDAQRVARLVLAEKNMKVDDEAKGGQQENIHVELAREERARRVARATGTAAVPARQSAAGNTGSAAVSGGGRDATDGGVQHDDGEGTAPVVPVDPEQERLAASFAAAAAAVADAALPVEDRLARWLRGWCADWEADLEARSEEVKALPAGKQASVLFAETVQYLRPLFSRLHNREIEPEMLAGIKLIADSMRERNYLQAYKVCARDTSSGMDGRGTGRRRMAGGASVHHS